MAALWKKDALKKGAMENGVMQKKAYEDCRQFILPS